MHFFNFAPKIQTMLRKILIVGAGKSTSYLLDYFLEKAEEEQLHLIIGDVHIDTIPTKFKEHPHFEVVCLDILNTEERQKIIQKVAIVVSMLPAFLHIHVAKDCIAFSKHLVTASYVSDEIKLLDQEAKDKGLIFMNEIGLDPGIDHMSAIQIINEIKRKGGKMLLCRVALQNLFKKALISTFHTINYLDEQNLWLLMVLGNLKSMPIAIL
jgi:saccharopine dehydrogenase-like NADP-dependent oxidoreductase